MIANSGSEGAGLAAGAGRLLFPHREKNLKLNLEGEYVVPIFQLKLKGEWFLSSPIRNLKLNLKGK